jgi:hypothetical protein
MRNPILNTIGNTGDNTASLLQMAMAIRPKMPAVRNRRNNNMQGLLSGLTGDTVNAKSIIGPGVSTQEIPERDMAQPGNQEISIAPTQSNNRSNNKYGVNDKLWETVSPFIQEYGLSVIEGYRDPNKASSKSAKNSQHYYGNALDLNYSQLLPAKRRELVKRLKRAGIGGFGLGNNTLHVDLGNPRYWTYDKSGNWISGLPDLYRGIF